MLETCIAVMCYGLGQCDGFVWWDEHGGQPSPALRSVRRGSSGGCRYQSELEGDPPILDTHFKFGRRGQHSPPRLEVTFLRLFGEVGVLGERKILIVF